MTDNGFKPYYTFSQHLTERFGGPVYRIALDAGFTCPNRDGIKAVGGCIYCDNRGSGAPYINTRLSITEQLLQGQKKFYKRKNIKGYLAYFQAYSNTYAPVSNLRMLYEEALTCPNILGLIIGTRPDCVSDEILELLEEYARRTYIWVEYGLQSIHDRTLEFINRAHYAEDFFNAVERSEKRGILIGAHIILGLPGESYDDMLETVKRTAQSGIDGIKIHSLYVSRYSLLADYYTEGKLALMTEDEYVSLVTDCIEYLPRNVVIMRVMGEARSGELLAPEWTLRKADILQKIREEFKRRGTVQGSRWREIEKVSLPL